MQELKFSECASQLAHRSPATVCAPRACYSPASGRRILVQIRERAVADVFVVQPTAAPVKENLM